jgi:flavorubredoxin
LLPQLKATLNGNDLKYIFISHFESDECGGLALILEHFPKAKPICSEVTTRKLNGNGLVNDAIIKRPGEKLNTDAYELEFFSYPSEMHLGEGLLAMKTDGEYCSAAI